MPSDACDNGPGPRRKTRQREALLAALRGADRPLSLEELHAEAKRRHDGIGLRTVYRHLEALLDERTLIAIDYPGQPTRYETVTEEHRPHLVCLDCRKLFLIDAETPDVAPPEHPQFEVTGSEVVFYGHCRRERCPERAGADKETRRRFS